MNKMTRALFVLQVIGATGAKERNQGCRVSNLHMKEITFHDFCTIKTIIFCFSSKLCFEERHISEHLMANLIDAGTSSCACWLLLDILKHFLMKP